MTVHYPTFVDQVHQRYPFFLSTLVEQQMLFGRHELRPLNQQLSTMRATFETFLKRLLAILRRQSIAAL